MTNHVHLILDPGEDLTSISVTMKTLAARQTRRVNELERRTGSLWEGRFKLSPIETSEYLLQCCRYVDLNPVKARVVNEPDEYRWSSFRSKTGREPSGILDKDECYLGFTNPENDYCNFVRDGIPDDEYQFIKNQLSRNQLTGGDRFTDEVERRIGIRVEARAQGRPRSTPTDK
jgi:putative transposase